MNYPAIFPRFDYVDDVAAQTGGEMVYTEDAGPMKQPPNLTYRFA